VGLVICPKCQNLMRTVDKNGVHIDQCEGCKGVFLDRGELEQIAAAETAYYSAGPPPYSPDGPGAAPPPPMPPRQPYQHYPDSPRPYRGGYPDSPRPYRGGYPDSPRPYGGYGYRRKKRRSFLEELFD
jgi:hypothetical protein